MRTRPGPNGPTDKHVKEIEHKARRVGRIKDKAPSSTARRERAAHTIAGRYQTGQRRFEALAVKKLDDRRQAKNRTTSSGLA
jgi:hypothetical protein